MAGIKYDEGKVPLDLLDPIALEGLAKVLQFGANKYAAHNWRGGISYSRLLSALLRHSFAILRGESTDPESGLPHIDHVQCCAMFLSNMMKTREDLNDLYKKESNVTNETISNGSTGLLRPTEVCTTESYVQGSSIAVRGRICNTPSQVHPNNNPPEFQYK